MSRSDYLPREPDEAARPLAAQPIHLPRALADQIEAHARAESPRECCGLLLGDAHAILELVEATNVAASDSQYLVDPRDHFAALRRARERGLEMVGAYHSHPRSGPQPSPRDVAEAIDHFLYLIVSPGRVAGPAIRAFRFVGGNFREVALVSDA